MKNSDTGTTAQSAKAAERRKRLLAEAKQGSAKAQFKLAIDYIQHGTVPGNQRRATLWFQKAAEQAHPVAILNVGIRYYFGIGVRANDALAKKYLELAVKERYQDAVFPLAMLYLKEETPASRRAATRLFKIAASFGDPDAAYELGVIYNDGNPRRLKQAAEMFLMAAMAGISEAQFNLALHYYYGEGVPADPVLAVKWYRKAANNGDKLAQCNLGVLYLDGDGVPANKRQAFKWLTLAAKNGDRLAQRHLRRLKET